MESTAKALCVAAVMTLALPGERVADAAGAAIAASA